MRAIVKIYPSSFSQLVEGLDAIFERPYGCFEQTSSTTYPNVLALEYLRRTARAFRRSRRRHGEYIHLGYQRLLSFEIRGGGFDWFGHPPANRTLTAYGLMEFQDMAQVHDVDPKLIERTRRWLLDQQKPDGSWEPEGHSFHGGPAESSIGRDPGPAEYDRLHRAGRCSPGRRKIPRPARRWPISRLKRTRRTTTRTSWHLIANALLAIDPEGAAARAGPRPLGIAPADLEGRQARLVGGRHGIRLPRAAHPVLRRRRLPPDRDDRDGRPGARDRPAGAPEAVRGALTWLVAQKDGQGTWGSTQATVLALKALLAGTGKPLGGDKARRIAILLDGEIVRELEIPADQADVLQQVDLSDRVGSAPGPTG